MDTKFQVATEAVETAMIDLDLANRAYKENLKKRGRVIPPPPPHRQAELTRPLLTRSKSSRGQRVRNPLKPQSLRPR